MDRQVLVSIKAIVKSHQGVEIETVLEEYMPARGILSAGSLAEAIDYFHEFSDYELPITQVRSLKLNGHEMIHTFLPARKNPRK